MSGTTISFYENYIDFVGSLYNTYNNFTNVIIQKSNNINFVNIELIKKATVYRYSSGFFIIISRICIYDYFSWYTWKYNIIYFILPSLLK